MPAWKHTMIFELRTNLTGTALGARIGGWSESVYYTAPSTNFLNTLQIKRAAILPAGARIVGQRIQQVFPAGASATTGQIYPGTYATDSDIPQMSLLCTSRSVSTANARRFTLRGIPDDMVFQGEYRPQGTFNALVGQYFAELARVPWKFPGRDFTVRPLALVGISALGEVETSAAFTAFAGDKVRIRATEVAEDLTISGTFVIKKVTDSTHFTLVNWRGVATTGGTILNVTPRTLFDFGESAVSRVITRKVGRPFGQYRGRASKS